MQPRAQLGTYGLAYIFARVHCVVVVARLDNRSVCCDVVTGRFLGFSVSSTQLSLWLIIHYHFSFAMFTTPSSLGFGPSHSGLGPSHSGLGPSHPGLGPQQSYSSAASLNQPPGLNPLKPTFPSPRKLAKEGLDPTEVGAQNIY